MKNKKLHIVCFDVPFPVSHGGFFDPFYKLVHLHNAGVAIHLHCFEYGREPQPELEKYCKEVHYYRRKKIGGVSPNLPYIVSSRKNVALIKRLAEDDYPILLEGTHCTYLLYKNFFPARKIIFRLHNIEHIYYKRLFKWESSLFKKVYYLFESFVLKKYEKRVAEKASVVLTVSQNDTTLFKQYCPKANTQYLPLFLPFERIKSKIGSGDYLLYHGNLAIAENQKSVYWLLQELGPIDMPLIIAGRNPPQILQKFIKQFKNCQLKNNPTDWELEELIQNAHINIVLSFNNTGIKLKLLHALFSGRHCIANSAAVANEAFKNCCHIADTATEIKVKIAYLKQMSFLQEHIDIRENVLLPLYNNSNNAQTLSAWL